MEKKSIMVAVLLQCIPLLGAGSCVLDVVASDRSDAWIFPLLSLLLWGGGYLYLGRSIRFLFTFFLGPVLAFGSASSLLSGFFLLGWESGHSWSSYSGAVKAAGQTALIIAGAVLLLAVDAARLAAAHNAQVEEWQAVEAARLAAANKARLEEWYKERDKPEPSG